MIECTKREDAQPICPHCSSQLRDVFYQQLGGVMGKRYVYFCGGCRKVLGISHRKGFWMGQSELASAAQFSGRILTFRKCARVEDWSHRASWPEAVPPLRSLTMRVGWSAPCTNSCA